MLKIERPEDLRDGQVIIVQAKENFVNGDRQPPKVFTIRKNSDSSLVAGPNRISVNENFFSRYFVWEVEGTLFGV